MYVYIKYLFDNNYALFDNKYINIFLIKILKK